MDYIKAYKSRTPNHFLTVTTKITSIIGVRKCKKCGSDTTYRTKKDGMARWFKYENGWQCHKCYLRTFMNRLYKNKKTIEFHTVFEADKAAKLFKWERHHTYGSVRTTVSLYMMQKLKRAGIGFWVVENGDNDVDGNNHHHHHHQQEGRGEKQE